MERQKDDWSPPADWGLDQRVIWDLGFFGHYIHVHHGGRSGKKHILTRLAKHGGTMTQRELQESFDISSGSMSEVLAKLECEGLIERAVSAEDARVRTVSLTEQGRELVSEIEEGKRAFEHEALAILSQEEKEKLLGVLDELIVHWKGME